MRTPRLLPIFCLASALVLCSCGSSSSENAPSADVAQPSTYVPPVAPSGPYDDAHRDEAIALAKSAGRKTPGRPTLSDPVAEFGARYPGPQLPGQPPPTPVFGWDITFKAVVHADEESPDGALPSPAVQIPGPGNGTGALVAPPATTTKPYDPKARVDALHPVYAPAPQVASNLPKDTVAGPIGSALAPLPGPDHPLPTPQAALGTGLPVARGQTDSSQPQLASHGSSGPARSLGTLRIFVSVDGKTQILQ